MVTVRKFSKENMQTVPKTFANGKGYHEDAISKRDIKAKGMGIQSKRAEGKRQVGS